MSFVYKTLARWGNLFLGIGSIVLFSVFIGLFFWGRGTSESLSNQVLERKKVIARSGSSAINSFYNLTGKSMQILAANELIYTLNPESQHLLQEFIESWADTPLVGVGLVNADGEYQYIANRAGIDLETNVSVADRPYFIWAKAAKHGEVYYEHAVISRIGVSKGEYTTPLAVALRDKNDEFRGVLTVAVILPKLTRQYLDPLKELNETLVYIVSRDDGLIIYATDPELVGKSVVDTAVTKDFLGRSYLEKVIKDSVSKNEEGSLKAALPGTSLKIEPYLISWSPMNIGNLRWHIVVMTPEQSALQLISPFYMRSILIGYIALAFVTVILVRFAKLKAAKETQELEHEIHRLPQHPEK